MKFNMIELHQVWQHFKGTKYSIVALSLGAEGDELVERVSYREVPDLLILASNGGYEHLTAINSLPTYSRPVSNFLEEVDRPGIDYKGPRFVFIENDPPNVMDAIYSKEFSLR